MQLYQQRLQEHFRSSKFRGELADAPAASQALNPSCGDMVAVQCKIIDNVLVDMKFTGSGCVISQAAASLLAETVVGKSITDVLEISAGQMKELVGIPLGPTRMRCALLALEALHESIKASSS